MSPSWTNDDELDRRVKAAREEGYQSGVENMARFDDDGVWHFDRKIPLALVFAMFIQTLGIVTVGTAWKTSTDAWLERLEFSDADRRSQETRFVKLEERLSIITIALGRIETKLETSSDRVRDTP